MRRHGTGRTEGRVNRRPVTKWMTLSNIGFLEEPVPPTPALVDPASRLPREVMVEIFSHLDLESLIVAGQVCKRWREVAKRRSLWLHVDARSTSEFLKVDWHIRDLQDMAISLDSHYEIATVLNEMLVASPSVRRYLRTIMAAPYLRTLALDSKCEITDRLLQKILEASLCEVHTLEFNATCNNENRQLLKKFAKNVEVLKMWDLTTKSVPIINSMKNLKVLHFCNDKKSDGVPLFPARRLGERGTLLALRPLYVRGADRMLEGGEAGEGVAEHSVDRCHVFQSTVRSLVQAHADTLRALHLPKYPNSRMLSALERCGRLDSLVLPLQPRLNEVCARVPSVRCLTVRLGSFKASVKHHAVLGQLPPTVEELTLVVFRRSPRLGREFRALGQACSGLAALKHLCLVCVSSRRVDVARLSCCVRQGLGRDAPQPPAVAVKLVLRDHKDH